MGGGTSSLLSTQVQDWSVEDTIRNAWDLGCADQLHELQAQGVDGAAVARAKRNSSEEKSDPRFDELGFSFSEAESVLAGLERRGRRMRVAPLASMVSATSSYAVPQGRAPSVTWVRRWRARPGVESARRGSEDAGAAGNGGNGEEKDGGSGENGGGDGSGGGDGDGSDAEDECEHDGDGERVGDDDGSLGLEEVSLGKRAARRRSNFGAALMLPAAQMPPWSRELARNVVVQRLHWGWEEVTARVLYEGEMGAEDEGLILLQCEPRQPRAEREPAMHDDGVEGGGRAPASGPAVPASVSPLTVQVAPPRVTVVLIDSRLRIAREAARGEDLAARGLLGCTAPRVLGTTYFGGVGALRLGVGASRWATSHAQQLVKGSAGSPRERWIESFESLYARQLQRVRRSELQRRREVQVQGLVPDEVKIAHEVVCGVSADAGAGGAGGGVAREERAQTGGTGGAKGGESGNDGKDGENGGDGGGGDGGGGGGGSDRAGASASAEAPSAGLRALLRVLGDCLGETLASARRGTIAKTRVNLYVHYRIAALARAAIEHARGEAQRAYDEAIAEQAEQAARAMMEQSASGSSASAPAPSAATVATLVSGAAPPAVAAAAATKAVAESEQFDEGADGVRRQRHQLEAAFEALDDFAVRMQTYAESAGEMHAMCLVHGALDGRHMLTEPRGVACLVNFQRSTIGHPLEDLARMECAALFEYTTVRDESELRIATRYCQALGAVRDLRRPLPQSAMLGLRRNRAKFELMWQTVRMVRALAARVVLEYDDRQGQLPLRPHCVVYRFLLLARTLQMLAPTSGSISSLSHTSNDGAGTGADGGDDAAGGVPPSPAQLVRRASEGSMQGKESSREVIAGGAGAHATRSVASPKFVVNAPRSSAQRAWLLGFVEQHIAAIAGKVSRGKLWLKSLEEEEQEEEQERRRQQELEGRQQRGDEAGEGDEAEDESGGNNGEEGQQRDGDDDEQGQEGKGGASTVQRSEQDMLELRGNDPANRYLRDSLGGVAPLHDDDDAFECAKYFNAVLEEDAAPTMTLRLPHDGVGMPCAADDFEFSVEEVNESESKIWSKLYDWLYVEVSAEAGAAAEAQELAKEAETAAVLTAPGGGADGDGAVDGAGVAEELDYSTEEESESESDASDSGSEHADDGDGQERKDIAPIRDTNQVGDVGRDEGGEAHTQEAEQEHLERAEDAARQRFIAAQSAMHTRLQQLLKPFVLGTNLATVPVKARSGGDSGDLLKDEWWHGALLMLFRRVSERLCLQIMRALNGIAGQAVSSLMWSAANAMDVQAVTAMRIAGAIPSKKFSRRLGVGEDVAEAEAEVEAEAGPRAEMCDVVDVLLKAHPGGARQCDKWGALPLHLAAQRGEGALRAVRLLLDAHPKAAAAKDGRGRYALHEAALYDGSKAEIVSLLLRWHGQAVFEADDRGYFPIHYACINNLNPTPVVSAAAHQDAKGMLPLHTFALSQELAKQRLAREPETPAQKCDPGESSAAAEAATTVLELLLDAHPDATKTADLELLVEADPSTCKERDNARKVPFQYVWHVFGQKAPQRIMEALVAAYPSCMELVDGGNGSSGGPRRSVSSVMNQ
eukprot:g1738.t1